MGSSRQINIGGLKIGGNAPVRVESMLKTRLEDMDGCLEELKCLKRSGCELARVAFPDESHIARFSRLIAASEIPIMADIHFNHKFAIAALDCGAESIRINPGNMTDRAGLESVLSSARANGAAIRIGSNGGSLSGGQLAASGGDRVTALVNAVAEQLGVLADAGFDDIIISAKSSSVTETVRANFILSGRYDFPLHIGITEAGPGIHGAVKSAAGLGILLAQGIGDTMRVSLTGDSKTEVDVAYTILRSLGLRERGMNLISCPCCGRRRVDVGELVELAKGLLPDELPDGFTVAVMGCEVNGPREAAAADIGIAGTSGGFVLFRRGKAVASGGIDAMSSAFSSHLRQAIDDFS
ncbi:MAG: flavodoxin-dependent (E)-4-hydroxy-3-methylbut-2-enyl-diphosphate synthase [Synergistaceae bacterium]|jgi:(E)-4-hydroxy-3-methylbut-2-enyl-diphosphate synthase|nr:flavodoxin-dependent (E)-4-hydroxy-3-methylbut-2-enyl-diphosphate synthase [Synergistaceae bacterium]